MVVEDENWGERCEAMERGLCREELATMDSLRRTKILECELVQRMLRKSRRVLDIWEACKRDWNQTLHVMTAYAMGAPRNSRPFEELAGVVSYVACMKERSSHRRVEALLLGASGLLDDEFFDDYIVGLQEEYDYLRHKYNLRTMNKSSWCRGGNFPAGGPVVRIVQWAALVAKEEFSMDSLMEIKSTEDVERMFAVTTSDYWQKRFKIDGKTAGACSHLGRDKVNMLAINLVVPMQFAYGTVMGREELKARAMDLLERIPAERNRLVSRWTGVGVPARSAYDTQALIELSHKCDEGRCEECPLGKQRKRALE